MRTARTISPTPNVRFHCLCGNWPTPNGQRTTPSSRAHRSRTYSQTVPPSSVVVGHDIRKFVSTSLLGHRGMSTRNRLDDGDEIRNHSGQSVHTTHSCCVVKRCHGREGGREGGGSVMVRVGSCLRARAHHPIG